VIVIVDVAEAPTLVAAGELAAIEKPAVIVNVTVVERDTDPLAPMMLRA
jgi:hypothetical protein